MKALTTGAVLSLFDEAKTVAVCAHVNPDGDAIGSMLGLAELLRAYDCEVTCLLAKDQPAPILYSFLDNYEFVPAVAYTMNPDLFIAVDLPTPSRLGDALAVLSRAKKSLCIDHHPDHTDFADAYYGDATAAATGSLIWSLIKASGVEITKSMASACYVAIMTDTGRFSFQNTNVRTFKDAAEMVGLGVDPKFMSQNVYENRSLGAIKIEALLVDRMRFSQKRQVVYSWIDEADFKELRISRDDTEGLPNLLRSIAGVQIAALLRVEGDTVRVNLRSRGICDVGRIARGFGGGGHYAAAGFTYEGSFDDAAAALLSVLENSCTACSSPEAPPVSQTHES